MPSPDARDSDPTLIGSVQRALRLVDIVANEPRPMPVKALVAASGLTPGTTYNLVRTLVHEGYLAREPDGLLLGTRFPAFVTADAAHGVFLSRVRTALRGVTDELGATAYLSRFEDGEVHLVDIVDAVHNPRVELWVGLHSSAHATALGKQILAVLPEEERLDYVSRHPLAELTQHTISDRRVLLDQLERSREQAVDREEYAIGYTCVAVPLSAAGITASLAVSLPTEVAAHADPALVHRLQDAASRLALQIGADRLGSSGA
ncbi:IclR family transcriptional regulator [Agromyces sp. CCNWLW203]|uniref:IclR family transcriptional regulator n=1 Tax=Agromyces sp. CCNWLW203 TaxID=3112842 RepID=UPI002F968E6E